MIIPIRTECTIRRTPVANYGLIGVNVFLFLLFADGIGLPALVRFKTAYLALQSHQPHIYQFFTYQFIHADFWHLGGNMLFLWVFGNSVNAKMGNWPYLLFYLAGGVFAACGFVMVTDQPTNLIGASGAIAASTTAYLALFPRSRVTVLIWFFFIHLIELPAMVIIGLKIIVWDNLVAPSLGGGSSIAYSAHLAGYVFGFSAALILLLIRALPRDQFDILALWKRWNQRREFKSVMSDPANAARARFGTVARTKQLSPEAQAAAERRIDEISELRTRISEQLERSDIGAALVSYDALVHLDPRQTLSEHNQLVVSRECYRIGRFSEAAAAFERFLDCYPTALEAGDVRLLLGIVYARDLKQYENAETHLERSMENLQDQSRRQQCGEWLDNVRAALGRTATKT